MRVMSQKLKDEDHGTASCIWSRTFGLDGIEVGFAMLLDGVMVSTNSYPILDRS